MEWLTKLNDAECDIHAESNYCEALRIFCSQVKHKAQFFPPYKRTEGIL